MKSIKIIFIILVILQTKLFAQIPTIENNNVKIRSVNIDSKIIGNTAVTKVLYVFHNPSNRNLEAKLTFPLPDGITVSQYAIDINGKLRYAVPVPKERAKEVFESIQHRNVDPGLIEKVSGNNFRTRISPITPNGTRSMEVTFLHELKSNANSGFDYFLAFNDQTFSNFTLNISYVNDKNKPTITENIDGSLDFKNLNRQWVANLSKTNYKPASSLRISLPFIGDAANSLFQSASNNQFYFINTIPVEIDAKSIELPKKIAIIWDNSFSASNRNFDKEWDVLARYLQRLSNNASIELYTLNNQFKNEGSFQNKDLSIQELKQKLQRITYDGATDYSKIKEIPGAQAVLLFSDGITSFGDLNRQAIKNKFYCITSSSKSDFSLLRYISEKNGGQLINLNEIDVDVALTLLTKKSLQFLGIKNEQNIREVYPKQQVLHNGQITVAGILSTTQGSYTALFGYDGQVTKEIPIQLTASSDYTVSGFNVAQLWAQKKINELEINYFDNRKDINQLSSQFRIVSKNTSLIVLEEVEDYVKYQITPPDELLNAYNNLLNQRKREFATAKKNLLDKIAQKTQELKVWHATDFTVQVSKENDYPTVKLQSMSSTDSALEEVASDEYNEEGEYEEGEYIERNNRGKIVLAEINSKASYMKDFNKLQSPQDIYTTYLKLRDSYKYAAKFYFDVANLLYPKDKSLAIQVLSTLADLDLENEELYKTIHYVLKQWKEYEKDLWVTQKVLEWRPFDPQSHRDYGLSLLDNNKPQEALNVYRNLIYQDFSEDLNIRDNGIEEILVMEINNIISRFPNINKDKVNKAFIADLPVDIRVVLNWNKDFTDIDLWIIDPNQEQCFYAHRNTKIGGRLSNDFTQGFGPEQFLLKKAIKGTYQIKTNFFAERQFSLEEPTAVMAEIFLNYSSGKQERKIVVFQYDSEAANSSNNEEGKTLIGKFVF